MNAPDILEEPPVQLYEKRKSVFPQAVDGTFRRLKWAVMAVTLAIYYVTPWIRWDRGPYAPDQAVLVDLANRRFFMFGIEIWPQEFYYIVGLLVMAGVGLFLVTSAVGRAWCGYACPQTVWTDLFQHVERFIDGDRNAQIKLQRAPWGPRKIARRLVKWSVWLVIAFATGGAWIFYFADAPTLAQDFVTGDAAFIAYATVGILTATTFIFGGFLREQVCIYMCPWPRIQSAMLDEKSLIVTYKDWRGEPRARGMKKPRGPDELFGDCIDCMKCVSVCPTGVDIREGPQIGCITCALCIDACDKVMDQIGRPRGLIDYATLEGQELEREGKPAPSPLKMLLRPRTIFYFAIWAGIGLAMLFAVGTRSRIDISAVQERNPPYVQLADGTVRNDFTIKISNMQTRPRKMEVGLVGLEDGVFWQRGGSRQLAGRILTADVPADSVKALNVFVAGTSPEQGRQDFAFSVRALDSEGGADSVQVHFSGPEETR
jgi:cytochrome c oxidase accessory protein FixG|tara:strand:- start:5232 stop:6692 length:1461 start_codon:yes stop_codon:yes gene_type:complete